jgi:hypothetical protein
MSSNGHGGPSSALREECPAPIVVLEALSRFVTPETIRAVLTQTGRHSRRIRRLPATAAAWVVVAIGIWSDLDIPAIRRSADGGSAPCGRCCRSSPASARRARPRSPKPARAWGRAAWVNSLSQPRRRSASIARQGPSTEPGNPMKGCLLPDQTPHDSLGLDGHRYLDRPVPDRDCQRLLD